jgi:hypothetical protein
MLLSGELEIFPGNFLMVFCIVRFFSCSDPGKQAMLSDISQQIVVHESI